MRTTVIALLTMIISACATNGHYGSFLPEDQRAVEVQIAQDAVKQLTKLYPPAKTRFELQHEATGSFGVTLVMALRQEGYAVKEYAPKKNQAVNAGPSIEDSGDRHRLRYVLDVAGAPNFYRLTLMVGDKAISRPYQRQGAAVEPAGYWAREE